MDSKRRSQIRTGVYQQKLVDFGKIYSDFVARFNKNTGSATTFLGVARSLSADGKKTTRYLVMESYEKHANKMLNKICVEVKRKYRLNDIVIIHALGKFKPGEPIVFVGVSSPRRDSSFKALREAVERYKKEPALFKQEIYLEGSSKWIA